MCEDHVTSTGSFRRKSWISVAKPFRAFARPLRDLSEKNNADVTSLIQRQCDLIIDL